jgi:flagellar capping protein FliD
MAKLNTRMIDMKRLLNAINSSYQGIFMSIQTTLNNGGVDVLGSNSNVVAVTQGLSASADNANKYLSDAEFRKGIMDYTSEKNRYSNILLSFYAFLNIAALAAIFQLARS